MPKKKKTNLTTKRPADGVSPMKWKQIIGKKAKKNYKKAESIFLKGLDIDTNFIPLLNSLS